MELQRLSGIEVRPEDLDEDAIPEHLRFLVCVTGPDGEVLRVGRDLEALQADLGETARRRFMDRQGGAFNRDGETDWCFGSLPGKVTTPDGTRAWPALVDQRQAVGLRLFETEAEAAFAHEAGVIRLLALKLADKARYLQTHHGLERDALLAWSTVGNAAELVRDLFWRSLVDTVAAVSGLQPWDVRSPDVFGSLCDGIRSRIGKVFVQRAGEVSDSLCLYGRLLRVINGSVHSKWPAAFEDLTSQLEDLIYPGFLTELEGGRLSHYPRYLGAIEERLAQLEVNPPRDAQRQAELEPWWRRYLEALAAGHEYDHALDVYRWLLHEFRVSLFAQRLGTAEKVSPKRLDEAWRATGY